MDIQTNRLLSAQQMAGQIFGTSQSEHKATDEVFSVKGLTFGQILAEKQYETDELRFSKHATLRMSDRHMEMTETQLHRLNDGARKAAQKGIKDSLVLVDDMAFIVNVPNRTVITAMDSAETSENVFTNINGAVIM